MRLHTGLKPFKCPHCDQYFRTSGHRKSHVAQHFKDNTMRPRKTPKTQKDSHYEMVFIENQVSPSAKQMDVGGMSSELDAGDSSQLISVDQELLQTQGVVPLSVSVTDMFVNATGNDIAMQVLQGGIQVQVAGQHTILTGIDNGSGVITQPIQLDASLLQQLQQGNVNLCIDPKYNSSNAVIANVVASSTASSVPEVVAPNLVIKSGVEPEFIQSAFGTEAILQGISTAVGENLLEQFQTQASSSDNKLISVSYGGDTDEADDGDNVPGFDCADGSLMLGQKFMTAPAAAEREQQEEQRNHVCGVR